MRSHPRRRPPEAGFQLIELIVALAVLAFIAFLVAPSLLSASSRWRVDSAARELLTTLRQARSHAVRQSSYVGLRFYPEANPPMWGLYRDGDGDGVRGADIESGVDPVVVAPRPLQNFGPRVGFGFRPGPAPPDPDGSGRPLERLDDPIRFNNSDIASFSTRGTATPGTLYLTDGRRWQLAVRLNGRTGRARILTLDPESETWR